ncbi:hypothetical protein KM043_004713 [Ampulex compressa]|nr:hypothetical protein KM043_004713 [Ampulex compressa]
MLQEGDEAPYEGTSSDPKGDEIQKLSVVQSLPGLLAADTQSCMLRVVPKMQQSLAGASTEYHIAASATFKTILEQRLVSHSIFSQTFLQSILNSLDSRDPVVCHAWLETLLDVIELLPVEVIRAQILPLAIGKGQLSQPIYSRVTCSRLLGKICTRFDSALIQKEVLPTVHSLCQDVNSEVRASICSQLRFVAEGLGEELVKPSLLPSFVELASDEECDVRQASVLTIVHLLPHLQEDTIKTIIAPLVKKLCENAAKSEDNVLCMIAQEYGRLVFSLDKYLSTVERSWFLKYYQQLAQIGVPSIRKETKPHFPFINSNPAEDERHVECRRCCAFNLPAMFVFITNSPEDTDDLLVTLSSLANDHYYMVRRTVACGIHEVAKVLGPKCGRLKGDVIKLLKDDSEEVLQGLVPRIGLTLDCLTESQTIGVDRVDSTLMEIGRALLKCEAEIAAGNNWRLASLMHAQLEILPKCFPSDFIYSYFVPIAFRRILHARPIPVRLAAGILFLVLLRYNAKLMQRVELRNRIYTDLATSPDCYVRMMFVRMMVEAMEIFSSVYFKKHFFAALLALAEDPIANIRIKVVQMLPQMKAQLWLPNDKKLFSALETSVRHLLNNEKDRDVLSVLTPVVQKLEEIDVKYEGQTLPTKMTKQEAEDARKLEEEKRLSGITIGKSPTAGSTIKKAAWQRSSTDVTGKAISQPLKDGAQAGRQTSDSLKISSMPEIPVMLSDDEFLVDAGIKFPSPQPTTRIPHLQELVLAKRRPMDRSRRVFESTKRHSSIEDYSKMRSVEAKGIRSSSMEYEEGTRENLEDLGSRYPAGRSRFGFYQEERSRRCSLSVEKPKSLVPSKFGNLEKGKRHSLGYLDSKQKRYSLEVPDSQEIGRRCSSLDVNHNQGVSKIPLRSLVSRSRTAPATRASSPVHVTWRLRFEPGNRESACSTSERRLTRFSSSDEEVDKICRMLMNSSQGTSSSRGRDSRLPVRLLMKEL